MKNYSSITRNHILNAIADVLRDGVPERRHPTKYVLVVEGQHLPPKYVLGLAYQRATGTVLSPEDFSGGDESNRVLKRLGFEIRLKRSANTSQSAHAHYSVGAPAHSVKDVRAGSEREGEHLLGTIHVAAIALRVGLGKRRKQVVRRALEMCFANSTGRRLALLPGVDNDAIDRERWAEAMRALAAETRSILLFESTEAHHGRVYRAHDGVSGQDLLTVQQVFATSTQANANRALVDTVLRRSTPNGPGTFYVDRQGVGLLVCGENNVLCNAGEHADAVSVRHYPHRTIYEHARVICNGAHTVMGNWGKLDRRFEYLSRDGRCALYATNCAGSSFRAGCRIYIDGRRVVTGGGIDAHAYGAQRFEDEGDEFCALIADLRIGGNLRERRKGSSVTRR